MVSLKTTFNHADREYSLVDMDYWIRVGADQEQSTRDMEIAFIHSMISENYELFLLLISRGVSLESTINLYMGSMPYESFLLLIRRAVSLESTLNLYMDSTPIIFAMERMTSACFAKTLIKAGANLNVRGRYGSMLDYFFYHRRKPWNTWSEKDELEVLGLLVICGHPHGGVPNRIIEGTIEGTMPMILEGPYLRTSPSLQSICRKAIREVLQSRAQGKSILPLIDSISCLPLLMHDYLKLEIWSLSTK